MINGLNGRGRFRFRSRSTPQQPPPFSIQYRWLMIAATSVCPIKGLKPFNFQFGPRNNVECKGHTWGGVGGHCCSCEALAGCLCGENLQPFSHKINARERNLLIPYDRSELNACICFKVTGVLDHIYVHSLEK